MVRCTDNNCRKIYRQAPSDSKCECGAKLRKVSEREKRSITIIECRKEQILLSKKRTEESEKRIQEYKNKLNK